MRRGLWSVVLALLVLGGCVDTGTPAAPTIAGPDLASLVAADGPPPDDPPKELLEERPPTRQAERLLQKTRQTKELCAALGEIDAVEEPRPHDPGELGVFATQYLSILQAVKPRSRVRNPDRPREDIDLPPPLWDDVQAVRRGVYAFSVRVAFTAALADRGRIDTAERDARLDRANVALATSEFTAAFRRLVVARPRYC